MELTVKDLTCVRGGRTVFEGLNLRVKRASGVELTGPNGAGKSSLLRVIAGLVPAAKGEISLEGAGSDAPVGELCHYVGHLNGIKRAFTVRENLEFWASYLGGGNIESSLATFGLEALADIPAALLSAGQARRLGLSRLLVAERALWLLDEPSVSLDEASRKLLGAVIAAHIKTGGMAVAATHAPLGANFAQRLKLGPGRRA
jgi:heme exporter protein A